ncbi:SpoIIE family protein phosphatase [Streptomyces caniscabiei]|uniref:GAF domain-containing SpoIIE family protein phosphatase n=1 Tax=Streptomyces caniscabiei TaxID=2746961 RepID=UPI0029BB92CE|nr:SpoIIE family protein phosphatase [Streptomyces caniscabiei]MDX2602314.1 SpoIIE family protein phosphatase [Streptomyces caniscabiei]MDX2734170.1 SpoIIE family protein phosphatase [Streptomyces caniscabiei]MDX2780159.1 SpoIIE family protein phosphatase [Streptomyces caniscabiei]
MVRIWVAFGGCPLAPSSWSGAGEDVSGGGSVGPELLASALTEVASESGTSVTAAYLLLPDEPVLQLAVLGGVPWEISMPWARVALKAPSPVSEAVRERRLVWVSGQEELARHYPRMALIVPYRFTLAAAPITTGTDVWGGLVLQWPASHPPRPSPREREDITGACHRLGLLLRKAADSGHPVRPAAEPLMLPPLRRRLAGPAEAQAAVDFAERLPGGSCSLDVDGRITFLSTEAAELLGADIPELLGARPWEALRWLADPTAEDSYRAAMLSRETVSFIALRPPDRWLSFHLVPDASGISVRIAPTHSAHTHAAVSSPAGPGPPEPPATGRATNLYHLMHLAATLTEAVGVRDVVEQVADQVLPASGAAALALMTAEDGRLRIIGYRGYTAELMERFDVVPLTSDTPAVHTLTTGVPAFFASFEELKRAHPPAVLQDAMGAWAFLPLITSGRPVGSLVLAYEQPHPFPPEERAVLTSTAGLIAQALDRARLYDTKHQLAHNLQAGLLPHTLPRVAGLDVAARYLPATRGMDVGGDFYDLIRLGPTTAAAAIGDVQGHNVNAAALMGQVRTAVHATAGAAPDEVLTRTNRLLTDLDPDLFTSCLYVHLDLAAHTACLAVAGHPPPLLRHPGGRTEPLLLPPGLLLGIDSDADYASTEIPLPPGSVLALYTDGLVEAPGIDIEEAVDDLARALARSDPSGPRAMDAVADSLVQHARRSAPRSDDMALLLIHPTPSPSSHT